MIDEEKQPVGRAKGGKARAEKMTAEQRKASAMKAVQAKKHYASLPEAEYGNSATTLKIGDIEIPCYVLDDGRRVLSQGGLQSGIGMSKSGGVRGEQRIVTFLRSLEGKGIVNSELTARCEKPIEFRAKSGGRSIYGVEAVALADICDVILEANSRGLLLPQQKHFAKQCEILVRGFARVGIVALIDEATGYQKNRERDALAKYLEEFIAKEMRPWVKTYPAEFFEELCRLRGVEFKANLQTPRYFGRLINNITYERMLPNLREALKAEKKKANKAGAKMHQFLSEDSGAGLLHKRLISTIDFMRASQTYEEFIGLLDRVYPVVPSIDTNDEINEE